MKKEKQKQMGVALPDALRASLDRAAAASGRSVAEEIRIRVERTFDYELLDVQTNRLMLTVARLANWVRIQTGMEWHNHPAANRALQAAIDERFTRWRGDKREAVFQPGELPATRVVAPGSDDPVEMGRALEAVEFHSQAIDRK